MALQVKTDKTKLAAIGIGLLIAVSGLIFGTRMISSRAAGEAPEAVTATEITSTSAVITWETANAVQEGIRYGKGSADSDLTSIAPETEPTKSHKVQLSLLEAGQTYSYKIIGASDTDYSNGGVAYSFTTLADDSGIPTSGGGTKSNSKSIQRLVIPDSSSGSVSVTPSINCKTETNCALIKANFSQGCSTADYVACTYRNK